MALTLTELVVGDEPEPWEAAGFIVTDGVVTVGRVCLRLVGRDDGKGLRAWGFAASDGTAPPTGPIDGIETGVADAPPSAPDHPNGVRTIDHVVVLSPQAPRTTTAFEQAGLAARRTRDTDQYGLPMRQTFFRAGEVIVELIGPTDATDDDGPATFFGIAYTVTDLDATAALLGDHLGRVKDAVQPGRRITTLRHRDLGLSVPTAFMSPPPT